MTRARDAAWLLGLLALNGVGMPRDPAAAQQWFERANALGKTLAASGLAWCRIDGCVSTPDPAAARRWTRQLRTVDAPRADYLDWLIDQRLAPLQLAPATPLAAAAPRDGLPPSQVQSLGRIAQAGSVAARAALALNDITAGRDSEALRLFESISPQSPAAAANASVLRARLSASQPIRSPAGSSAQAAEWLAEARRFHRGEGRPANYAEAIRLYRRAAAAGNLEAQRMLNLIATRIGPDGQLDIAGIQQLAWLKLDGTQVDGLTGPMLWQSDSTPLFDLLPPVWRQRAARS